MITITIKTDNAAFGDLPTDTEYGTEVARILDTLAEQYRVSGTWRWRHVRDVNGNTVGTVRLTGRDRI